MERQRAIKLLDETFNSAFDINRFAIFIKELFNDFKINIRTWTVWKEYQDYIESYKLLGSYKDPSRKIIDVLVVKLKKTSSIDRARTMQRNFVAKYLANAEKDSALVAFYGDDPQDWRFSFVKMEYNLIKDETGKVKIAKELTPAKRYSFLVGVNEPNHTCRSQFLKLIMEEDVNPTLNDIENAFSIENVTKEFFNEYKELFLQLEESLRKVIAKDKNVKEEFEKKGISTVDFAKKLLGQIVFIYFLQKKGWLGVTKDENGRFKKWGTGPKNFLRKLFDKEIVHYDNFFNDILEPLFYEALATERDDDYYSRFNCKIPFLNGGLFEPLNDYDWAGTEIVLDNAIFDRILSTFDRFNFTVKEDEPLEKEVAVDPEMLGKVFENLLEIKDRKSKGAFYTPREIVHYMCQQSLINYLETNINIPRKDIEKFIQLGDLALDQIIREQEQIKKYGRSYDIKEEYNLPKSIKENYREIDKLLKEIKIVDPAVGSGAFPVGMMNEIVKARNILTVFFPQEEQKKRIDYNLKREIIENCLYGVDIEPSAVEITKLRFWLSLIVDEVDMHNIKPLPNLDHKIMCGNSLLEEFEGVKLFDERLLGDVKKDVSFEVKQIEKELKELYKKKGDIAKGKLNGVSLKEIEKEIKKLENKKKKILSAPKSTTRNLTLDEAMQHRIKESQRKLKELKRLQKQFFNEQNRKIKRQLREEIDRIEWELIETTLKEQGNEDAMEKLKQYKKTKAKPFFLWKLYFAEVFQRENPGFDVVIANPPYVNTKRGINETYKELFKTKYKSAEKQFDLFTLFIELGLNLSNNNVAYIVPKPIINNENYQTIRNIILRSGLNTVVIGSDIFETANVESCVLIISKKIMRKQIDILLFKEDNFLKYNELDKDVCSNTPFNIISIEIFKKDSPIFLKMQKKTLEIGKIIDIKRGVECGKQDNSISNKKNKYPLIRGQDLKKYFTHFQNKYIDFDESNPKKFKPLNLYSQNKILIRRVGNEIISTYDNNKYIVLNTIYCGHVINKKIDDKYLVALLNSKLISYWFTKVFVLTDKLFPYIRISQLKYIPIKKVSHIQQKPFIKLVDQILSITKDDDYLENHEKQAKVKKLEKEIDQLVYKLYDLTPEEIKIVEEFGKK